MDLEPPIYDVDSLGPLPAEFDPLNDDYVAPRYDADFWPLYEEDVTQFEASPRTPSPSLLGDSVNAHPSTNPFLECKALKQQQQQQQQYESTILTNEGGSMFVEQSFPAGASPAFPAEASPVPSASATLEDVVPSTSWSPNPRSVCLQPDPVELDCFIDLAELDQYLNGPEESSSTALRPESMFDAIIRTDQYENSVAVQLDHSYGTPPSTSAVIDSMDLDPSILNEFFSPLSSTSPMGPCDGGTETSTSYLETFTNLEPYIEKREDLSSPTYECYVPRCSSSGVSVQPSTTPESSVTSEPVPSSETPSDYRMKRDRNNIASQKSRRKRQVKFQALKEEELELKKRNTELLATVGDLERQVNNLKDIMMKAVSG